MEKIKVLSVFGARPDAVKMAPLVKELAKRDQLESRVCVTAQHRQMLDQMLHALEVKPDYDLDIMLASQTLTQITVRALEGLERVLGEYHPDLLLVHGDTSTAFAGALAAFYAKVKVGHVEAGLRSHDKLSPYPEEMNRCLAGVIANMHFAPTRANADNLAREGITSNVYITGNTVIDAIAHTVRPDYVFDEPCLNQIDFASRRVIFMTAHRRENYGRPMEQIMKAVAHLARSHRDVLVVYAVHLSPYVQETAHRFLDGLDNVWLTAPLGIFDSHNLQARCHIVLTDSGGLQEEAPSLGKPVLVLRKETERPEAVEAGTVRLAGVEEDAIYAQADRLLRDAAAYAAMSHAVNPYGDGHACARIADNILYAFGARSEPAAPFSGSVSR